MHKTKTSGVIVTVLTFLIVIGAAIGVGAQSFTDVVALTRGQTVLVTCDGANRLRIDRQSELIAALACGRPDQAQPTVTPVTPEPPAPTATAIPTQPPSGEMIDMMWHPAGVAHGDRPAHEHGDPVPQWVTDAGYTPMFSHQAGTPGETVPYWKHTAFKQWAGNFNGQDWFGIFHLDFQPGGHASRFHSYQLWAKDDSGAVSAISGWLDFGVGNNTGPNLLPSCGEDSDVRPIMNPTRAGCPIQFESWYARAGGNGGWAPDFGFNINPNFYAGGDPTNPTTWTNTGYVRNLERRIEFAWYLGGDGIRPAPTGEFWATQWGDIVSGPSDPVCGTQRTFGERNYTALCLRQFISPALRPMTFPGNSDGGVFPGDGVVFPN